MLLVESKGLTLSVIREAVEGLAGLVDGMVNKSE
jgi:hypothetical protein